MPTALNGLLLLFALTQTPAQSVQTPTTPRAEIDASFDGSPSAAALADLEQARADVTLSTIGRVAHVDERYGVPNFVWGAQGGEGKSSDARAAAGQAPEAAARAHLARFAPYYRFDDADLAALELRAVDASSEGGTIVTYARSFDGVEVFRDELRVLLDRDLELIAVTGYVPGRDVAGTAEARRFEVEASEAVAHALEDFGGAPVGAAAIHHDRALEGGYDAYTLDAPEGAFGLRTGMPIRAKRVLFHMPTELVPGYYVELAGERRAESYVISARDGGILFRHGLTEDDAYTYRVWAETSSIRFPMDGPQGFGPTPHPTGIPDNYNPPFVASNLITLQNGPISTNDPWLPPGATSTVGNNVDAYIDQAAPDGLTAGDWRAPISAPATFNYGYNFSQRPGANGDQISASITQLFYTFNFLHDWFYDKGFNEAARNAQTSNFGRGGVQGDPLKAELFDYSGSNNANMTTFGDGTSPYAQAYDFYFPATSLVSIQTPASVAGPVSPFGSYWRNPPTFDFIADVARPKPGTWTDPARTNYQGGSGPQWARIANVNNDVWPDLVGANYLTDDATVWINNGDGAFQAQVSYPMGDGPFTADVGDLNADGVPDLVVANNLGNSFSVRLGTTPGAFGSKTDIATGAGPGNALIASLGSTTALDVVTCNYWDSNLSVHIGNGDGTFQPRVNFTTGLNPNWVEAGDVDGDGNTDLVSANTGANTISVLKGSIFGFAPKVDYPCGTSPLTLKLGDLNGDRKIDAVVADFADNRLGVLLNNGSGGFLAPVKYAVPSKPVTVTLGDMNGDGLLDAIVCSDSSNSVSILPGLGNGTLGAPTSYPVGTTPYGVAVADCGLDGVMDITTANYGSNSMTSIRGSLTPPAQDCPPYPNALNGRIALVQLGGSCGNEELKIAAAQNAGAAGVVIVNPSVFDFEMMTYPASIPVFMVGSATGQSIATTMQAKTVTMRLKGDRAIDRDGALDNTMMAHEWGHYLSNRLIGNANGLTNNQGQGMGEGWGDFVALLMSVRAEDAAVGTNANYNGVYGPIGAFPNQSSTTPGNSYYFGFRRYPYSTDLARNPLTFKHIASGQTLPAGPPVATNSGGNEEVHNTGEIWCSALWECYAALLRDTGRLTFAQAQDRMRGYLVASLKLTPSSPTFVEARDAVLAAALAGNGQDYAAFCAAFAKRGLGNGAVAPSRFSSLNSPVTESFTCTSLVAVEPPANAPGALAFSSRGANPIVGDAHFAFTLPTAGFVTVDVFDVFGRRVARLANGPFEAGMHDLQWTAPRAAGVYFADMRALGQRRTVRTVVLK